MTHTIQQVFNNLTAAELLIGNKHPAFAKISEAIAMLKDMQVVDVEVVPINSRIQRAAAALAALPPQRDELVEELVGVLKVVDSQLECPVRNTTVTSHRRDGSVIISSDVRQLVKGIIAKAAQAKGGV